MPTLNLPQQDEALTVLRSGGLVVLPTDTLYGIVASALDPQAVEQLYALRTRDRDKPVIILIADAQELERFSIFPDEKMRGLLRRYWPGPVSIVLAAPDTKWQHLSRGTDTLAFRVPKDEALREFLRQSGPLAAPSANIAGELPATTIAEARQYFGDQVALYVDGGKREASPSTLVRLTSNGLEILRQGAVIIDSPEE